MEHVFAVWPLLQEKSKSLRDIGNGPSRYRQYALGSVPEIVCCETQPCSEESGIEYPCMVLLMDRRCLARSSAVRKVEVNTTNARTYRSRCQGRLVRGPNPTHSSSFSSSFSACFCFYCMLVRLSRCLFVSLPPFLSFSLSLVAKKLIAILECLKTQPQIPAIPSSRITRTPKQHRHTPTLSHFPTTGEYNVYGSLGEQKESTRTSFKGFGFGGSGVNRDMVLPTR